MASEDVPTNPPGGPYFTQRLWSEEVAIARAEAGEPIDTREPGYEFSNGRKFSTPVGVYVAQYTAPSIVSAPVISGLAEAGATLSSTAGSWNGDPVPSITYQWKAAGVAIPAANGSSYVVLAGDNGKSITCTVTATNVAGAANATSNSIYIPAYTVPVNTVAPVISGVADVGETLTATHGTWTGNPTPTYTYQWMLGVSTIVGETNSTYVVISNDQGNDITCEVTATNAAGSSSATSNIISIPAAFSPIDLFASGEQGAWYDPSDLTTMFQDSAGTTPVTADGQTVWRINDKSGNGNHIIFNAGVPLGQDVDGAYYLQGNGANGATASAVNLGAFDKISIVSAVQMTDGAAVFSFGNITADAGSFEIGSLVAKKPLAYWRGSTGFCAKYYGVDIDPKVVFSTQVNIAGTNQATECPVFRLNANDVATSTVNSECGSGNLGSFVFKLLAGYSPTFLGKFYGIVAVTGLLDAETNLNLETWMGNTAAIPVSSTVLPYQIVPTTFTDSLTPVDKTTYLETSAYAQVVVDTTATEIEVVSVSNIAPLFPDMAEIGVYVDGVFNSTIQQSGDGTNTNRITLSAGSKQVSFVNGAQSQLSPIKGTFIHTINANAPMTQAFPTATNRILIYGDSISVGANAVATQQNAWAMQLRRYRTNKSTMVEGQGYRSLYDDARDATARTAFVAKVVSANPETLWMAIGTNDYGIPKQSASDFGTDYADLLDALHTALPSLVIYCQTPIVRTSEAANGYGNTLGDYRSQIATAVSTRTGYCTLVDGTTLVSTGDLQDGVHPTDAGHGIYYAAVKTVLGI